VCQPKNSGSSDREKLIKKSFLGYNIYILRMPPKAKAPEKGICFPKDPKGGRSTSDAGKAVIAAALRGAETDEGNKFAEACEKEKNWRFGYSKHFKNLVKVCYPIFVV
jgi:hypothetical protein